VIADHDGFRLLPAKYQHCRFLSLMCKKHLAGLRDCRGPAVRTSFRNRPGETPGGSGKLKLIGQELHLLSCAALTYFGVCTTG